MSSKLDYLSKYYNNDTASDSKKKKKDKKGKKKRKEAAANSLRVVDEDEAFASQLARDHPAEEDQEEDEDGPVVVNPEAVPTLAASSRSSRGQWQEVDERPGTRRPRYDSSDAEGNTPAEFSKANRRRLDSDDEPVNRRTASSVQKKQRYDSDEDDDDPRRKGGAPLKKESDDDGMAIKEEDEDQQRGISSQRKKARYDSDEESAGGGGGGGGGQSAAKRDRHDSSSSQDSGDNSARRMSSGHRAGLQTGQLFSKAEAEIQKKRKTQAQGMVDRYGMGETVHRGQPKDQTPAALTAAQQAELNQGRAQKLKAAQERQQMERIQQSDFARRVDDDEMETLRKQALRAGDPMAQYAQKPVKKSSNSTPAEARLSRPVYKGPPAKSNRFGIRPGFRWDGNDRGIGFEDRLLGQRSGQNHRQEEAYRWSSAGM